MAMREFCSWPLVGLLLSPWNRTRSAPPPREANQVDFMALACTWITLDDFRSCPGPFRCHTGVVLVWFLILVFYLYPLLRGLRPGMTLFRLGIFVTFTVLLVFFCDFLHPASGIFPQNIRGACRALLVPWAPGYRYQTLGWVTLSDVIEATRTTRAWGFRLW